MSKQSFPPVPSINQTTIKEFKSAQEVVIVGFCNTAYDTREWRHTFTTVAQSMRTENTFLFGLVNDEELAKAEGVYHGSGVVLYKNFDKERVIHNGELDKKALENFVHRGALPLLAEVDRYSLDAYVQVSLAS